MFFAETIQTAPDGAATAMWLGILSLLALMVLRRMLLGIQRDGVKTRPDLFESTDYIVAAAIMGLYLMNIVGQFLSRENAPAVTPAITVERMAATIGWIMVFPGTVVLLLIARNLSPVEMFGLRRAPVLLALCQGVALGVVALPLTAAVKLITVHFTGSTEAPQQLVQSFSGAVTGGSWELVLLIAISAILAAPLAEEILFRGYFYPVLGRGFGRVPAAVFCAVLFAAVHDTWTDIPGLTVLALCFTIAYERTGSLLVPLAAHATFNASSLLALWAQAKFGLKL